MPRIDFGNNRGENLADPKYDKDAVNFRTHRRDLSRLNTEFLPLTGGTMYSGGTLALTQFKFNESTVQPTPSSGLMWYSGGTLYFYSGNTGSDLVSLY